MNPPLISLDGAGVAYKRSTGMLSSERFWALRDISLDINPGETLGVLGSNGSGKSTLLRLLARIYQPDAGSLRFSASKISLLSLSLGFDPELSGFDNAILSSMLLGATLREAKSKLDSIIAFSELGEFAAQPIKTYSSGMRSRLGFSVAINMNADVLLIDEALAVGDASFRKKSEEAILNLLSSDQTVVLVSHSIVQIVRLCDRAIWLKDGRLMADGDPESVAGQYQSTF
jgi:lipopolysaccharide transport system ATP-binding protein